MHFPNGKDTEALFFQDRLEIKNPGIIIPYSAITNLESMTDRRITKTRVLLTGVIAGLLWKRNYLYTVVEYDDGFQNQSVVVDFHRHAVDGEKAIYERMIFAQTCCYKD